MDDPSPSQRSAASPDLVQRLSELFKETGQAHHQAFIEVDGNDPDWPLWYADHMREPLGECLNATFTKTELVYLFVLADKEHGLRAPGAKWPPYYARFFIGRYL